MELIGEYVYTVYYTLPDGSKIDIERLISFSMSDNYDAVDEINSGETEFSDRFGCLKKQYYEIRNCFVNLNLINKSDSLILDTKKVIDYLNKFYSDASELLNNKDLYIRETKLNKILK